MPFKAIKKSLRTELERLGQQSPTELMAGVLLLDSAAILRPPAEIKQRFLTKLEEHLLSTLSGCLKESSRPTKLNLTPQEKPKKTKKGLFNDILVRVTWGDAEGDVAAFYLELPRSLGEVIGVTRLAQARNALNASLGADFAYVVNAVNAQLGQRLGGKFGSECTRVLVAEARSMGMAFARHLEADPDSRAEWAAKGVYLDELLDHIAKLPK